MENDNCVIFKGGRNGIIVLMDNNIGFDILKEQLRKKVGDAQKFFNGAKAPITFKGRTLSDEEEKECIDIIVSESKLNITFIYNEIENSQNRISKVINNDVSPTKYYFGAIRSGQSIQFPGSVVVMGDVNPGGEIIADGNIIVIGTLKGVVRAGFKGRADVFIAALRLIPVQLRIADIITYFPEEVLKNKNKIAEYAYIKGDKICVESINKRLEDTL